MTILFALIFARVCISAAIKKLDRLVVFDFLQDVKLLRKIRVSLKEVEAQLEKYIENAKKAGQKVWED